MEPSRARPATPVLAPLMVGRGSPDPPRLADPESHAGLRPHPHENKNRPPVDPRTLRYFRANIASGEQDCGCARAFPLSELPGCASVAHKPFIINIMSFVCENRQPPSGLLHANRNVTKCYEMLRKSAFCRTWGSDAGVDARPTCLLSNPDRFMRKYVSNFDQTRLPLLAIE